MAKQGKPKAGRKPAAKPTKPAGKNQPTMPKRSLYRTVAPTTNGVKRKTRAMAPAASNRPKGEVESLEVEAEGLDEETKAELSLSSDEDERYPFA